MDALARICIDNHLRLLRRLPSRPNAPLLAQVQSSDGNKHLLKRIGDRVEAQFSRSAYAAWKHVEAPLAQLTAALDRRTFLFAWIDGDEPADPTAFAASASRLASGLHRADPAAGDSLASYLDDRHRRYFDHDQMPERHRRRAAELAAMLVAAPNPVLLHGDFASPNMLVRGDGSAVCFDARGFRGPAAFDLARYASAVATDDPRGLYERMLDAYGTTLPLAEEAFAHRLLLTDAWQRLGLADRNTQIAELALAAADG